MNYLNTYDLKRTETPNEYFAGMNTGHGFVGIYDELINENLLNRVYIIKGSAGSGKSTLMRKIADAAEGTGHTVDRYFCSSDPDSLDCILIEKKLAVLDGTSPHSREMAYPGAVSQIIDLTKFGDADMLTRRKSEIIKASIRKREAFDTVYSLLGNAEMLQKERASAVESVINIEKADRYILRLIRPLGKPDNKSLRSKYILRSIGMKGRVRLDTLEKHADTVYAVSDVFGSAYTFMNRLCEHLLKNGHSIVTSPDVVSPSSICDVYLPDYSVLFTLEASDRADRTINMSRFVDRERLNSVKGLVKLSVKCSRALIDEAVESLKEASEHHFTLERIYGEAMDFRALDQYSEEVVQDIVNILN